MVDLKASKFSKYLLIATLIINVVAIITGFLMARIWSSSIELSYLYTALIFIPFGFIFVFINEATSKLISLVNYKNKFKTFIFFFSLAFCKYLIILIPMLICIATNWFNIYFSLVEVIAFTIGIVITSIFCAKK